MKVISKAGFCSDQPMPNQADFLSRMVRDIICGGEAEDIAPTYFTKVKLLIPDLSDSLKIN